MNGTAFAAFTRPPAKVSCIVCRALAALSEEKRDLARDALDAGKDVWPHSAIADDFHALGQPVSETSVRTHRKRCA